jgi:hypothetical protein
MKLSKAELIELLAKHLGSDEDAVSSQLDKLLADILKAASKGESFSIQGFGTFTSIGDEIGFEVSPAFAAELNYSYEGMLPIDVDSASVSITNAESEPSQKPPVKKPVVIVDEDVEGEEDPFGLPDTDPEEVEFVDPIEFLNDLEGKTAESDDQQTNPFLLDEDVDGDSEETTPLTTGVINSIDDSVDEEEKQLLESGISLVDDSDDDTQDDPFGVTGDSDLEEVMKDPILEGVEAESEIPNSDEIDQIDPIGATNEKEDAFDDFSEQVEEELTLKELPKVVASTASESVLDEFFDPKPDHEVKPDGVLEDSNDDLDRLASDGEEPVQDTSGPRIVSVEEDKKDFSPSISSIIKWVAILLVVVMVAGGAYWFFTGPGSNLIRKSEPTVAQTVIPLPAINDVSSEISEQDLTTDSTEVSAPVNDSIVTEMQNDSEPVASDEVTQPEQMAQLEQPSNTAASTPNELSTEQEVGDSQTEVGNSAPDSQTNQNTSYGLRGSEQSIGGRVYSVIVHSLPSMISAQEQCNEISNLNLRCLVREATGPQGRTTYRVGIGQFDSNEAAEAAVTELPEPFKSRNFIARVN